MTLQKLLEKTAPRPWEEGPLTAKYQDIGKLFPPFEAIGIAHSAHSLQIAIIPLDESSRENALLILHAVNNFEQLLAALKAARDHLDYCGYGDEWERKGAYARNLPTRIAAAIDRAEKV